MSCEYLRGQWYMDVDDHIFHRAKIPRKITIFKSPIRSGQVDQYGPKDKSVAFDGTCTGSNDEQAFSKKLNIRHNPSFTPQAAPARTRPSRKNPSFIQRRKQTRTQTRDWTASADLYRPSEIVRDLNLLWVKVDQFLWKAVDPAIRLALGCKLSNDSAASKDEHMLLGDGAVKFISTYIISQLLQPLRKAKKSVQWLAERSRMHNLPKEFIEFHEEQTSALTQHFEKELGVDLSVNSMVNILDCQLRMSAAQINVVFPAVNSVVNVWERLALDMGSVVQIGDSDAAKDVFLEWQEQEFEATGVLVSGACDGLELVVQPAVQEATGVVLKKGIGWRFIGRNE
ncbi:hypothetical protein HDV00_008559 [Rhizophlyctis rosea]|nr:hypothetical protein HDV00_008559 [Rhizophlyctis rosea]